MAWQAGNVLTSDRTGAWQDWTPTFNDITVGSGATVAAAYARSGDIVVARLALTLGSGFSFGSDPRFTLPVNMVSGYINRQPIGTVVFHDGTVTYIGLGVALVAGSCRIRWPNPSNSNRLDVPTSSVPFSFVAGDQISASITYQGV